MPEAQHRIVSHGSIDLDVTFAGTGPLVLMVHGFPESAWSWRHQIASLAAAGYTAAALDVRGYGASSSPPDVADYAAAAMTADLVAVIDAFGAERAVLVGHDKGSGIVQAASLLAPDRVAGVALLSVPTAAWIDGLPSERIRAAGRDTFYYQAYFLEPGVAERELEADLDRFLRTFFHALSAASHDPLYALMRPHPSAGLLDDLPEPGDAMDAWMSPHDLRTFADAFRAGGLTGPLHRYRAIDVEWEQLRPYRDQQIAAPGLFVAGTLDPVRRLGPPGVDRYADPVARFADPRGSHLLDGVGHWTQQEAPDQVDALLLDFLGGLDR